MRVLRRAAVFVLLGLILGAPWAAALEARPDGVPRQATWAARSTLDILHPLWNLLARVWNKEGCTIDPLGGCVPKADSGAQATTSKEGCRMDPLGGCLPGTTPTNGVQGDEGCTMDPLGRCGPSH